MRKFINIIEGKNLRENVYDYNITPEEFEKLAKGLGVKIQKAKYTPVEPGYEYSELSFFEYRKENMELKIWSDGSGHVTFYDTTGEDNVVYEEDSGTIKTWVEDAKADYVEAKIRWNALRKIVNILKR